MAALPVAIQLTLAAFFARIVASILLICAQAIATIAAIGIIVGHFRRCRDWQNYIFSKPASLFVLLAIKSGHQPLSGNAHVGADVMIRLMAIKFAAFDRSKPDSLCNGVSCFVSGYLIALHQYHA